MSDRNFRFNTYPTTLYFWVAFFGSIGSVGMKEPTQGLSVSWIPFRGLNAAAYRMVNTPIAL